jgi:hypothetical protein
MKTTHLLTLLLSIALCSPALAAKEEKSKITVQAESSVQAFIAAMNSLDDQKILKTVSLEDRVVLTGSDNIVGLISEAKMVEPRVRAVVPVKQKGRVIGAKVQVVLNEIDPLDTLKRPKSYTWFLKAEGSELKVSVLSVWVARKQGEE